jgi:hypothetical protein
MDTVISSERWIEDDVAAAARRLYDCECALHTARQTHVDAWITAAADKLHVAILALDRAQHALDRC